MQEIEYLKNLFELPYNSEYMYEWKYLSTVKLNVYVYYWIQQILKNLNSSSFKP